MILIVVLISFFSLRGWAQEKKPVPARIPADYTHNARLGMGFSASGILSNIANYFEIINGVNMDRLPVISGTYLYSPIKRVSVGAGVAYQHFALTYQDPNDNNAQRYGLVANKWNVAAIGHFYYVRTPTFKMYSGLRLGFSNWNVNTETGFPIDVLDRVINFALGGAFAPQFIMLGGETYFTPNIGAHAELAIGSPQVIGFGLSYRW
ncbi:MAG: hypothetical protein RIG62_18925 [Cyclobacteriaceae bacterium]